VQSRIAAGAQPVIGVMVESQAALSTGGRRVTLGFLGATPLRPRPGQFIDVENASGERERVPVVAVGEWRVDVEVLELDAATLVRARGPFDSPR
jgi:hypothetical protein